MKYFIILLTVFGIQSAFSQTLQTYIDNDNQTHICGPFQLDDLAQVPGTEWYQKNYEAYQPIPKNSDWAKQLKDIKVEIYLGTWCGDSKTWVPRFVKLWSELTLDPQQLSFIGLYSDEEKYKQGPNGEEKGKDIHRVPTFIFTRAGEEVARIVESPVTSLETDLAQIALGYPCAPNYKAATYMINLLNTKTPKEIESDFKKYLNEAYALVGKSSELNTLGYVLLRAGDLEKALTVFRFNTYFFRHDPNVYGSYGEALAIFGDREKAIDNYEKVLAMDTENQHAKEQIEKLKNIIEKK